MVPRITKDSLLFAAYVQVLNAAGPHFGRLAFATRELEACQQLSWTVSITDTSPRERGKSTSDTRDASSSSERAVQNVASLGSDEGLWSDTGGSVERSGRDQLQTSLTPMLSLTVPIVAVERILADILNSGPLTTAEIPNNRLLVCLLFDT